jgi:CheY-like chemotaxis protein
MNQALTPKLVLVADDDPDDLEIFVSVFQEVDPSVAVNTFYNGQGIFEYLQNANNPKPQAIFLDINMPEMSGWQCLTSLQENLSTKDIPVIMYSTSSHHRDKQIASELGASGFITKPSDLKSLERILSTIAWHLDGDLKSAIRSLM